jgi:Tfp pilus assembly protein PilV
MQLKFNSNRGASLVEVLLAVALFSFIMVFVITSLLYGIESSILAGKRTKAMFLAEEGIEATRNIKSQNFDNLVDGTYGLIENGEIFEFSGIQDVTDIYTRRVIISTLDSDTKLVRVEIDWTQNAQRAGSLFLETQFTQWSGEVDEDLIFETGTADNNSNWMTVNLEQEYTNPVVIAQPVSNNGGDDSVVRIRNASSNSFEFMIQEAPCEDGGHTTETIGYLVVEEGNYRMPDGRYLEAQKINNNTTVPSFETVNFLNSYSTAPVVLTQVMTYNGNQFVKTRQTNLTPSSVDVSMEEGETLDGSHINEDIAIIALEPGIGEIYGTNYEFAKTTADVNDNDYLISFNQTFTNPPVFIASLETYNDPDTCHLRYDNLTQDDVEIRIEEDCTNNGHSDEAVSYVLFDGAINYPGVEQTIIAPASDDTSLYSTYPIRNYGLSDEMFMTFGSKMLIRFDLSSVPSGINIEEAKVSLYSTQDQTSPSAINLNAILVGNTAWNEGWHDGADAVWNEPCWNYLNYRIFFGSDPWTGSAGLSTSGVDYDPVLQSSVSGGVSANTRYEWSLNTDLVQNWLDTPSSNHGLIFSTSSGYWFFFATKENTNSDNHPQLIITYLE